MGKRKVIQTFSKYEELPNKEHLNLLPGRLKTIMELLYGLSGNQKLSREEVAERFGVTRERIRQAEEKSLKLLKEYGEGKGCLT